LRHLRLVIDICISNHVSGVRDETVPCESVGCVWVRVRAKVRVRVRVRAKVRVRRCSSTSA